MKKAEEYLRQEYEYDAENEEFWEKWSPDSEMDLQLEISLNPSIEKLISVINHARKDLLEELANETCIAPYGVEPHISREEILDKIKELK